MFELHDIDLDSFDDQKGDSIAYTHVLIDATGLSMMTALGMYNSLIDESVMAKEITDSFQERVSRLSLQHADATVILFWDSDNNRGDRLAFYPSYKMGRAVFNGPDLRHLSRLCRERCSSRWNCQIQDGQEADDLVAMSVRKVLSQDHTLILLVSEDRDYHQLMQLDPARVHQFHPRSNQTITYGDLSDYSWQVKALAGDAGDNVMGLPRVGVKKALSLIESGLDLSSIKACAHYAHPVPSSLDECKPDETRVTQVAQDLYNLGKRLVRL